MNQRFDSILKSGTVVNQDGEGVRDIGVTGGRIAAIGALSQASAGEVIDCKGLHILPGVMDTQVHFREPGQTHKEDLETGSRSAVMGGVTAVFEMPNTDPLTITEATFADKVKRGHHRMHCDFAFFIGGTRDNVADLPELERAPGCSGVKIFIGSENKLFSLSGSSTIIAPYGDAQGRIVGVLGVIGPTRLNYARVIPTVDYAARIVSRILGG